MIKIKKLVFEKNDITVVKDFLNWFYDNFEEEDDLDWITDEVGYEMRDFQDALSCLLNYMECHAEE